MNTELEIIREALLTLKPTGKDGFEGLLSMVFFRITGIGMRLASSGYQFGVDGSSEDPIDEITFEAKLYRGKISRTEVLTKIADLGRIKDVPDVLWILGATTEISAQLASQLHHDGEKQAISTLILDWSNSTLPKLAIVLAAVGDEVGAWIAGKSNASVDAHEVNSSLMKVCQHKDFQKRWSKLRSKFSAVEIATRNAIVANKNWLNETFSKESTARERLGQPVLPKEVSNKFLSRAPLKNKVLNLLSDESVVILLGEEGRGKTWIAAETTLENLGLSVLISSEKFDKAINNKIENIILENLSIQTGGIADEISIKRWKTRTDSWVVNKPQNSLLVVIDGINQRPDTSWDLVLIIIKNWLEDRGGKLLITSRPQFFSKRVMKASQFGKKINIENWSQIERDNLLAKNKIDINWIDEITKESLLNPRLLGIALSTIPCDKADSWKGLTVNRLLFEHILRTQRDGFECEPPDVLCTRLSENASRILEQIDIIDAPANIQFRNETRAVAETRFFKSVPGPRSKYILIEDGLNLALGFALVDQLWEAYNNNEDLYVVANILIEPISSLDATAPVVTAALMVCGRDAERFAPEIFVCLMSVFSNLQNLQENAYNEFLEIVFIQPEASLVAIKNCALDTDYILNRNLLRAAAFDLALRDETSTYVSEAIRTWLRHVNIDAEAQEHRFLLGNERDQERILIRQSEIEEQINSFSEFERKIYENCIPVSGDIETLFSLALKLLANKPLAPFATDFLNLGVGFGLCLSLSGARSLFQQLTRFNKIDPIEASNAFRSVSEPLKAPNVSKCGKWSLARMLWAADSTEDTIEAFKIKEFLNKDLPTFPGFRLVEEYCSSDPCNPNSIKPKNIGKTVEKYHQIDVTKTLSSFGQTQEDQFRVDALPAMARFSKEIAISKNRELLDSLVHRNGMPLRQLSIIGENLQPLMTEELASQLINRMKNSDFLHEFSDKDKKIIAMFLLNFPFPFLSGNQQLEIMTFGVFQGNYLLNLTTNMNKPNEDILITAINEFNSADNNDSIFGVLCIAANTYSSFSAKLDEEINYFRSSEDTLVRATVFEFAVNTNAETILIEHCQSKWTYVNVENEDSYEGWFGSILLINACSKNKLLVNEMFERISPTTWYYAANKIGKPVAELILTALETHLLNAVETVGNLDIPYVDLTLKTNDIRSQPWISASEKESTKQLSSAPITQTSENVIEDFDAKQIRLAETLEEIKHNLSEKGTRLLFERIDLDALNEILKEKTDILNRWVDLLLSISSREMYWLHNFTLVIANIVSKNNPAKAALLFKKALEADTSLKISYGDGLYLIQKAIWSCPDVEEIRKLWITRLRSVQDDAELSVEILAAERYGASDFISNYVDDLLASNLPLNQSYAIAIAGFSNQFDRMHSVIEHQIGSTNFAGQTARFAMKAHERAVWSQHWMDKMWLSSSREEFWLNLMIIRKVIDGRTIYQTKIYGKENRWHDYASVFISDRKRRIKKWETKRKKTLLGIEKPDPIFI